MEWRIIKGSRGDYVAQMGISHLGGASAPGGVGVTMPAFVVYDSARFDTLEEAKRYIKRKGGRITV